MDKLKAIFKRKKDKPASGGTAGTKTETPTATTTAPAAAVPAQTATDTAAAPSSSEPTQPPAGKAHDASRQRQITDSFIQELHQSTHQS